LDPADSAVSRPALRASPTVNTFPDSSSKIDHFL
jgi:hypothetical protein